MKLVTLSMIATALATPGAFANETKPLQLKVPKSALTASTPSHSNAPFSMPMVGNEADYYISPTRDLRQDQSRSSCANATTLCYDANERRLVYKPARALMPEIPGLRRENISVRRDRITFRYSF